MVANYGDNAVLTFSRSGERMTTQHATQAGGDGLVILPDGMAYGSSVVQGSVAQVIPGGASMSEDPSAGRLVIPMVLNHGLAFVPLDERASVGPWSGRG